MKRYEVKDADGQGYVVCADAIRSVNGMNTIQFVRGGETIAAFNSPANWREITGDVDRLVHQADAVRQVAIEHGFSCSDGGHLPTEFDKWLTDLKAGVTTNG